MVKRLLIATGGTGGHLFPAEALYSELEGVAEALFVGSGLSENRFFNRIYPYKDIVSSPRWAQIGAHIQGTKEAIQLIKEYKPDLVVGFGSYHTLSIMLAATLLKTKMVLVAADSKPGRVIRLFRIFAEEVATLFVQPWNRSSLIEMPIRKKLKEPLLPASARAYYQLDEMRPVILVVGGSQGSRHINDQIVQLYKENFSFDPQWIHITGSMEDFEKAQAFRNQLPEEKRRAIVIKPFEDSMQMAWRAADLAVTRAGSISLAEQAYFEVPGVAIPYPEAMDNHQEENGRFYQKWGLVDLISQKESSPQAILACLEKIFLERKLRQDTIHKIKSEGTRVPLIEVVKRHL